MTRVAGWGRFPFVETELLEPHTVDAACSATSHLKGFVARGNGRSYGDAAAGTSQTLSMLAFDRVCSFNHAAGRITVEAGILLADLIDAFMPFGFFPYVVPGTRFVSVGGAIAADVHGKNHHRDGGFGQYVESILVALPDGNPIEASLKENPDLFLATIGGMGLTGTILKATLRLRPIETGWIRQQTIVAHDLKEAIESLDANDAATYSVAWIDCVAKGASLGRSLIFVGEHASLSELDGQAARDRFPKMAAARFSMPVDFPAIALNHWSVAAFNELYFRSGARHAASSFLIPAGPYFFPLDKIGSWNRIYGKRGFVQHQCVLPPSTALRTLSEMLGRIAARGNASFLAVLKKLGKGFGLLSFPFPGYTLALDFPFEPGLLEFLETLDQLIVEGGGRLYLAKDSCQSRATFEAGYQNLRQFRAFRQTLEGHERISSKLSARLGIA